MKQDYKDILRFLYDEFGDDLIDAGKNAINSKLNEGNSQDNNLEKGKKRDNEQTEKPISMSEQPNTIDDEVVIDEKKDLNIQTVDNAENVDYYDADAFEQQTITKFEAYGKEVLTSVDVTEAVKDLILMAGEVRKFEEAQITVRTDIAAQRDVALAKIEAQKDALMTYFDKSFDERKENFNSLFSVVDDALEKDNMQQLALSLESIVKLAESSPFKDLKTIEATASALSDPDHEWEF